MINIIVNNRPVKANTGETILDMLKREGINVPTLCHMPGLFPTGACRMCVVEVEGMGGLIPSCAYPVHEGMKIFTHSAKALQARKTIVELLLANHPDECLYCVRNKQCDLQNLSEELGIRRRRYSGGRNTSLLDTSSPSLIRDPEKCILCGKCVRVCEEIQGVSAIDFIHRGSKSQIGPAFNEGLNLSSCIYCGQCVAVCPTGALREKSDIKQVTDALNDPEKVVVVQHAPSISVTLGEEFGIKPGKDVMGIMTAALRRMGFNYVFDTAFAADLTIMEEGSELVERIKKNGPLPMLTSCSPGWIKFVEEFYPDMMDNLSTCRSPQQMMGAVVKSCFADKLKINPDKIYSVSIMPCTAKKFEAERPEMARNGIPDVDAVLTTRELARMIKTRGLDLNNMKPEGTDTPFGERSSAGKLFGVSGGVMEAALRSAHFLLTGKEMTDPQIKEIRGLDGIKEAQVTIAGTTLNVAAVSGLGNARKVLENIKTGKKTYHFIEIMTCPGGCIAGGGQPLARDIEAIKARMKSLYTIDKDAKNRLSHHNEEIKRIYDECLEKPLSEKSHHLLHTHYAKRDILK